MSRLNLSQSFALVLVALAAISGVVLADDRSSNHATLSFSDSSTAPEKTTPRSHGSWVNWWSIPEPARIAVKKLAASRDASVTRCTSVESDDKITYEFHASRRQGLFRKTDFVLTTVSEPTSVAKKRQEDATLKKRLERLRAAISPRPKPEPTGRTGFLDPHAK